MLMNDDERQKNLEEMLKKMMDKPNDPLLEAEFCSRFIELSVNAEDKDLYNTISRQLGSYIDRAREYNHRVKT